MVRFKTVFSVMAVAAFTAGCATDVVQTKPGWTRGAGEGGKIVSDDVEMVQITGSRLPRKSTQNTQGVTQTRPEDWQRYNNPAAPQSGN